MLIALIQIIGGFILLIWAADRLVAGAAAAASNLGISPLVIGLTVVGIGTSAPEMVVSAIAALQGNPGLAVGNAIGSNITNIGLVLGVTAIIYPLTVESGLLRKEFPILLFIMIIATLLMWDGMLTQVDGYILLVGLVVLLTYMVIVGMERGESDPLIQEFEAEIPRDMPMKTAIIWLVVGLILLPLSSAFLVEGAVTIATIYGISSTIIGLTIVAFGTSLPELAASISSALKHEDDIAIGNVIGSNMFNLLGVLGIGAAITPIPLESFILSRDVVVMFAFTFLLFAVAWRLKGVGRITRLEGVALLMLYLIYTAVVLWQTLA
ncbi:MAG: calcium/sodium antiporter [Xanthomonadales bacterium]|nr:calcium/sodium antiporter [Xanthomonadales bacterium]